MSESPMRGRGCGLPCLVILAIVAGALLVNQEQAPLRSRHEARVLETARGMIASGDFLLPRLLGEPRLQKPPLAYWGSALAFAAAGRPSEPAARSVVALLALLMLAATWRLGALLGGPRLGTLAMALLASAPLFLKEFRRVTPDVYLAAFTTLAVAAHLSARRAQGRWGIRSWFLTGDLMLALALLAKGPIALAYVGTGVAALRGWARREAGDASAANLRPGPVFHLGGFLLSLLPLVIWALLVIRRLPGGLDVWWHEMGSRFSPNETSRSPLVYGTGLLLLSLPWTPLALLALFTRGTEKRPERWWLLAGLVFLCLLSSRKVAYLLPLAPAIALLGARGLLAACDAPRARPFAMTLGALRPLIVGGALILCGVGAARHQWLSWAALGVGSLLCLLALGAGLFPLALGRQGGGTTPPHQEVPQRPDLRTGVLVALALFAAVFWTSFLEARRPRDLSLVNLGRLLRGRMPPGATLTQVGIHRPALAFHSRHPAAHLRSAAELDPEFRGWVILRADQVSGLRHLRVAVRVPSRGLVVMAPEE